MLKHAALLQIDATLRELGFEESGPGIADYCGSISAHGQKVDVRIEIPDVTFVESPKVYLLDRSQIPLKTLAHIETDAGICFASGAGLPLDMYEPGQSVLRVLKEAERTLEQSYGGGAEREVVDEYQWYWHPEIFVRVFLDRASGDAQQDAELFLARENGTPRFWGLKQSAILRGYECGKPLPARLYSIELAIGPCEEVRCPETLEDLQTWWRAQEPLRHLKWSTIFDQLVENASIFVAAPNALIGFQIDFPRDLAEARKANRIRKTSIPKIISGRAASIKIRRLSGTWCDLRSIARRNSPNSKALFGVKVALVGCGTIGSHLARMLVQTGVGVDAPFELFDTQILVEGNIGRHLLDFSDVGNPKAEALAAALKRYHPQLEGIVAVNENARAQWNRLAKSDLIIDATGEWNVQCALNDLFLQEPGKSAKALLHCWVFMNGAGAQSFLNLRDKYACFRCLKSSFSGPWRYPAGDENIKLNLQPASCGDGSFVPFAVDASAMAASLAARAALDWASGQPGKRLRTAVVDLERGRLQKPRSPMPLQGCPACSHLREKH